jgi:hypothetical protein
MTERYTPAHVCACVGAWVRVRARVGTCVCACAWVRGFVSRFFSRGCVRVGACACACARVGGVGCKAAGTLARGQARWICTILLVVFLWGVGVEGGGVFWVGVLFGAVG